MTLARVVLADDDEPYRRAIARLLGAGRDFEVVGEASDGAQAVAMARELMPDVVLMDVSMPHMDGLEATRRIKAESPCVHVVLLTVADGASVLLDAVQSGAQGCVPKGAAPQELLETLRRIVRGEVPTSPVLAARIMAGIAGRGTVPAVAMPPGTTLTPLERALLAQVAAGIDHGEIAATLAIAEGTIGNHFKNILEKLRLESQVNAATSATLARSAKGPEP